MRHLTSLQELTAEEITEILDLSSGLKESSAQGDRPARLSGRVLTQIFEKPSLRTRASFDEAMAHLGGSSQFLSAEDAGLGGRGDYRLFDVAEIVQQLSVALSELDQQVPTRRVQSAALREWLHREFRQGGIIHQGYWDGIEREGDANRNGASCSPGVCDGRLARRAGLSARRPLSEALPLDRPHGG